MNVLLKVKKVGHEMKKAKLPFVALVGGGGRNTAKVVFRSVKFSNQEVIRTN